MLCVTFCVKTESKQFSTFVFLHNNLWKSSKSKAQKRKIYQQLMESELELHESEELHNMSDVFERIIKRLGEELMYKIKFTI